MEGAEQSNSLERVIQNASVIQPVAGSIVVFEFSRPMSEHILHLLREEMRALRDRLSETDNRWRTMEFMFVVGECKITCITPPDAPPEEG